MIAIQVSIYRITGITKSQGFVFTSALVHHMQDKRKETDQRKVLFIPVLLISTVSIKNQEF